MKRLDMILRVRNITRDFSNSIFREQDIIDFINEGIDRIRQVIPELDGMIYLDGNDKEPILLPSQYHSLLPVYSASRCFYQDERHYQATNLMNEFESKLEELQNRVQDGTIVIKDANGVAITVNYDTDYVVLFPYWDDYQNEQGDIDPGVGGVPA